MKRKVQNIHAIRCMVSHPNGHCPHQAVWIQVPLLVEDGKEMRGELCQQCMDQALTGGIVRFIRPGNVWYLTETKLRKAQYEKEMGK